MKVEYYMKKKMKNAKNALKNFDNICLFDPKSPLKDSNDRIIPINRIWCRYCLIERGVAVELDRKLRL